MLNELRNLEYHGGKEGLLFFLCHVIGNNQVKVRDAEVICAHAPGKQYLSVNNLIDFCKSFGWIQLSEGYISISQNLAPYIGDSEQMNETLAMSIVKQMFGAGLLDSGMFFYDAVQGCYAFRNERLPLQLSSVRNVLISQGFIIPVRDNQGARFYIEPRYVSLIAKYCTERHRQLSLKQLKKQLEENEKSGEKAELFVLSFEKRRIGEPLCDRITRISEIDVTAGYDIVSFCSKESTEPDRFIEVKAVSKDGFLWSKNEYEIAKLLGDKYCIYLVELGKTNCPDYYPEIIINPAEKIMAGDTWRVEAQSYRIKRLFQIE